MTETNELIVPEIRVESERGCGYRKEGGLYMMGGKPGAPCGRLPIPLDVCPACHGGIKPSRAWTWVNPQLLINPPTHPIIRRLPDVINRTLEVGIVTTAMNSHVRVRHDLEELREQALDALRTKHPCDITGIVHSTCPLADVNLPERAGLLWIGEQFYPTPHDFMAEAAKMGVSRRIPAVPKDFRVGEDSVLLAHRRTILKPKPTADEISENWSIQDCKQWFIDRDLELPDQDGQSMNLIGWTEATKKAVEEAKPEFTPGLFSIFKPTHLEYVCRGDEGQDELQSMVDRGIEPVIVQKDGAENQYEE